MEKLWEGFKPQEHGLAQHTLSTIENLLRTNVQYDTTNGQIKDSASWQMLLNEAKHIREGFFQKSSQLSWLVRFFGGVQKKEN